MLQRHNNILTMIQFLEHLPHNYRKLIAEELNCSESLVSEVMSKLTKKPTALITSQKQIEIVLAMKRLIDKSIAANAMVA